MFMMMMMVMGENQRAEIVQTVKGLCKGRCSGSRTSHLDGSGSRGSLDDDCNRPSMPWGLSAETPMPVVHDDHAFNWQHPAPGRESNLSGVSYGVMMDEGMCLGRVPRAWVAGLTM